MYEEEPFKNKLTEQWTLGWRWALLRDNWFPEVKWSDDEPTKVKLVLDK